MKQWEKVLKLILGIFVFTSWMFLFTLGFAISSAPYLESLQKQGFNLAVLLRYFATATPTNTALLSALSGMIGGIASNFVSEHFHREAHRTPVGTGQQRRHLYMTENPIISMFRGFVVYLLFIVTSNFTSDTPFLNPSPQLYLRLAVTISLTAFIAGYDPSRLQGWMDAVPNRFGTNSSENGATALLQGKPGTAIKETAIKEEVSIHRELSQPHS